MAVEASGDQRVKGLGHIEGLDRPGGAVHVSLPRQEPPVEKHAYGLDGVEGDAVGPVADRHPQLRRQAGDEPMQERIHGPVVEGLERQRSGVADPRAERRVPLAELRPDLVVPGKGPVKALLSRLQSD